MTVYPLANSAPLNALRFAQRLTGNELSDFSMLCDADCVEQAVGDNMWTEITRSEV